MQTTTVIFPAVDTATSSNYHADELQLKGLTTINFVLTAFDSVDTDIIQIVAVFGDGQDDVYNADVTKSAFVQPVSSISHVYHSQYTSYATQLSAVFQVVYTNLAIVNYIQPIKMLHSSYYQDIGHLHLTSTQLLPVSSNDALFVCYDDYSNLHNFALHLS